MAKPTELLQQGLDEWMQYYKTDQPHSGRYCYGKSPMDTFWESLPLADEKLVDKIFNAHKNEK